MTRTVGMIGLGNMGSPMAANLLAAEGSIYVYNRTAAKCAPFVEKGAVQAESPCEIAEHCDVIVLSLPGPAQVKEVVTQLIEAGHEGQIIIDTSTVSPELNREMAEKGSEKGITYLDCPVSGGPAGTASGTLSLMIGASEEEFDSLDIRRYTDTFGNKYFFMNGRGNGNAIKIINNFMSFAAQVINGEAIAMADAAGISLEDFYAVTTAASGNNMILGAKMNKVKNDDLKPGFATDLVVKDLELARELCTSCRLPNFSLNNALQMYRLAQKKGHGQDDSSSVIKVIRETYKED